MKSHTKKRIKQAVLEFSTNKLRAIKAKHLIITVTFENNYNITSERITKIR